MSPGCGWPRVAGSLIKKLYFGLKTSKKAGFLAKNRDFSGLCSLVSARESLLKLFIMFYLQGNTLIENCVFGGTGGWVRYRPGTSLQIGPGRCLTPHRVRGGGDRSGRSLTCSQYALPNRIYLQKLLRGISGYGLHSGPGCQPHCTVALATAF